MISFKKIEPVFQIRDLSEDPENSEEIYFGDTNVIIGKLNL
jgi:hypothetical protein